MPHSAIGRNPGRNRGGPLEAVATQLRETTPAAAMITGAPSVTEAVGAIEAIKGGRLSQAAAVTCTKAAGERWRTPKTMHEK